MSIVRFPECGSQESTYHVAMDFLRSVGWRTRGISLVHVRALSAAFCLLAGAVGAAQPGGVAVEVRARVAERCGIAADERTTSSRPIDEAQQFALAFELDCNTPFRIGVRSRSGAMRLLAAPDGAMDLAGFAVEKPYTVGLSLATDAGLIEAGRCTAGQLLGGAGGCPFSGEALGGGGLAIAGTVVRQRGTLDVRWAAAGLAEGRRLAAGDYQDVLTVDVAPSL